MIRHGSKLIARLLLVGAPVILSACYFSQECPQELLNAATHQQKACSAAVQKKKNLETIILLSILTGGFRGSAAATSSDSGTDGEDGGAGTDN